MCRKRPRTDGFAINSEERKEKSGGAWAARTPDHLIKSQMLYQLS